MVFGEMQEWQKAGIINSSYFLQVIDTQRTQLYRDQDSIQEQTLDAMKGCHFQLMSRYHLCTIVLSSPLMMP